MKINHIVSSLDISMGGPSKSVSDLAFGLSKLGENVTITSTYSENPYFNVESNSKIELNLIKHTSFKTKLEEIIKKEKYDILHGHGIWQMPVHHMAKFSRKNHIPYIITPRGMLEPWSLNAKKWKKRVGMLLYQRKDLEFAECLHATAQKEAENFRSLGFKNPIAVIPNGIDLNDFPISEGKNKETKTILFLSRIHKKKGIEMLIEAWSRLQNSIKSGWKIEIAGNGEPKYINRLQNLITKHGLNKEIEIIGPQFGEKKIEAYQRADLFVLPTYSENFGIVIAEALACGIPVITTKGAPWKDLLKYNAGWWIDIGTRSLEDTLTQALKLSNKELKVKGINGRLLVKEKYSIESVATQMNVLYEWILGKTEKPEFVRLD